MSHELEVINGEHSFFEIGAIRTAWHRLGRLFASAPKTMQELHDVAPWLDYEVEKRPTHIQVAPGEFVESTKAFVTYRPDSGKELGSVGPDYTVVQNWDAFQGTIGPLVDEGVLQIETGGVLRDGADAWLLGQLNLDKFGPVVREVFADEVVPYVLVGTNHSGRRNNHLTLTPVRVVCANTLAMAEADMETSGRTVAIRHTGDAEARMVEAAQHLLGGIVERYEVVAAQYRQLKAFKLDLIEFRAKVLLPALGVHPTQRAHFNPEARLAENMVERYETRATEITRLWHEGMGHAGDDSAWEAYNGVVEAIDHNEDVFPARSGVYRLGSLMDGQLRRTKQSVLTTLAEHVEVVQAGGLWRDVRPEIEADAALVLAR